VDREEVVGGGHGQDIVAGRLRWSLSEERHLKLAAGGVDDLLRECSVGGDCVDVGGGAEEGADVVAEGFGQGIVDALRQGGFRLAGGVEDEVAAGAECGDVLEAEGIEAGDELLAGGAAAADVDGAEEGDVAGHGRIVFTAQRDRPRR